MDEDLDDWTPTLGSADDDTPDATWLAPLASEAAAQFTETTATEVVAVQEPPPPPPLDPDGNWLAEIAPEFGSPRLDFGGFAFAAAEDLGDVDPRQILRDRPDVYAAYFRDFYGPMNDRNSPAWVDRVGGETAEDYALYWYKTYGRSEGYQQDAGLQQGAGLAAPADDVPQASAGRTTIDGIPLSKILEDRPDVFRAFFEQFYGGGNDRHSQAWVERVGGVTVEDYANYWYNAHGRIEGYRPASSEGAAPPPTPEGPAAGPDEILEPPAPDVGGVEDPPTDLRGGAGGDLVAAIDPDLARPLVIHYRDDGIDLLPATDAEFLQLRSLFDDAII